MLPMSACFYKIVQQNLLCRSREIVSSLSLIRLGFEFIDPLAKSVDLVTQALFVLVFLLERAQLVFNV